MMSFGFEPAPGSRSHDSNDSYDPNGLDLRSPQSAWGDGDGNGNGTLDALVTALQTLVDTQDGGLENSTSSSEMDVGLGARRDSLKIVIPVTVVYGLIFLTGVVGNISTCIVIKKNRSLHTATNYYLFSLAVSDFLLLLSGVPQEMYFIWSKYPYVFGEVFCVGRGLVAETSANATVLTITAFTVERYVAICHPFLGQAMSKLSRALRLIVLIWVLSVVTAVPQAAQFGIVVVYEGVEKCAVVRTIVRYSFQLSTFIFFLAPMSVILVLYLLIGLRLHRSNMIGHGHGRDRADVAGGSRRLAKTGPRLGRGDGILYRYTGGPQLSSVQGRMGQCGTRRVLKMLVAVVIGFFLCWAPFHAQRLIAVYGGGAGEDGGDEGADRSQHEVIYTVATYVSGVLYYLSTCINPLLYNIMSHKFREAFKSILFGKKYAKGSSSVDSRRQQESRRLRRNPTLTSTTTTQRETSESELQAKPSVLQAVLNERKVTSQLLP